MERRRKFFIVLKIIIGIILLGSLIFVYGSTTTTYDESATASAFNGFTDAINDVPPPPNTNPPDAKNAFTSTDNTRISADDGSRFSEPIADNLEEYILFEVTIAEDLIENNLDELNWFIEEIEHDGDGSGGANDNITFYMWNNTGSEWLNCSTPVLQTDGADNDRTCSLTEAQGADDFVDGSSIAYLLIYGTDEDDIDATTSSIRIDYVRLNVLYTPFITINDNATIPTTPEWNNITQIWTNITPINNLLEVNFSVVPPNGTAVILNQNASWGGGNSGYWNSSTFTIGLGGIYEDIGTWEWNYTAMDDSGNNKTESGNFTITNQAPTNGAVADPSAVNEDSGLNDNIITNDTLNETWSDLEEPSYYNTSWITAQTDSSIINCVVDSDNNIDCTTQANQSGTNTITMHLMDSLGANTSSQTINIVVDAVNDAPSAPTVVDNSTDEDVSFDWNLTHYISDIDSTVPNDINFTFVTNGTSLATFSQNNDTLILTVNPNANESGIFEVNVTFFDLNGSDLNSNSTIDRINFTINAVNDAPWSEAIANPANINEDSGLNDDIVAVATINTAFRDVEDDQSLTSCTIASESDTTAVDCSIDGSYNIDCTTQANQSGNNIVTLNCCDSGSSCTNMDTFTVTVDEVNDAPVILPVGDFSQDEDFGTFSLDLTNNETDVESSGAGLNWTLTSNDTNIVTVSTVDIEIDSFNLVSVANATGLANITLNLTDGDLNDSSSFILTINAVNDAPWIDPVIPNPSAVNEDSGLDDNTITKATMDTSFNDVEDATPTTYTVQSQSASSITNCVVDGSNNIDCTTQANQSGTNTITIRLTDSGGLTVDDNVDIVVNSVNDVPWWDRIPDNETEEDTAFNWNLTFWTNDVEDTDGPNLNISYLVNDTSLATFSIDNDTNVFTVTPIADKNGMLNFNFTLDDKNGGSATIDIVNFTINAVNDAPVINSNETIPTTPEWLNSTLITANVTDIDGNIVNVNFTLIAPNGTAIINNTNSTVGNNGAFWNSSAYSVDDYGTWIWTVNLTDSDGATDSDIGEFTITNVAPTISEVKDFSLDEDFGTNDIDLTNNETDLEDSGTNLNWNLTLNQSGIITLTTVDLSADQFRFTSIANVSGSVNISLTLNDTQGAEVNSSFILTINAVNDPPVVPVLNSPENNTLNGDSTPTLRWKNSNDIEGDAITYGLLLDDNTDFSSPVRNDSGIAEGSVSCGSNTCSQFTIPDVLSDGTYYWKINASDGTNNSAYSITWQFDVDATYPSISEENTVPDTSTIYINTSVYVNSTITDNNLDSSTIRMESNFNGSWFNYSSSEGISNVSDNFTFFMHLSNWSNQQSISWRYRATDDTNKETIGTMQSFTIQNRVAVCTLNSPTSGSTQTSSTVTLSVIPGDPDGDDVNVTFFGTNVQNPTTVINITTNQANGTTFNYDWEDRVDGTTYFWRAKCGDGIEDSAFTSERNFTIAIPNIGAPGGGGGGGATILEEPLALVALGEQCTENVDCTTGICDITGIDITKNTCVTTLCGNRFCDVGEANTCPVDCNIAARIAAGFSDLLIPLGILGAIAIIILYTTTSRTGKATVSSKIKRYIQRNYQKLFK